jgi:hypothetical protein
MKTNNEIKHRSKAGYEIAHCTRCGGSGHYSFCQSHGTTCFKCSGSGWMLTKRGYATKMFLEALRTKPAAAVKVGDAIRDFNGSFQTVTEVKYSPLTSCNTSKVGNVTYHHIQIIISTEKSGLGCSPDYKVRCRFTGDAATWTHAAAMAYQDGLTKTGKHAKCSVTKS